MLVISSRQSRFDYKLAFCDRVNTDLLFLNKGIYFSQADATALDFTPRRKYLENGVLARLATVSQPVVFSFAYAVVLYTKSALQPLDRAEAVVFN